MSEREREGGKEGRERGREGGERVREREKGREGERGRGETMYMQPTHITTTTGFDSTFSSFFFWAFFGGL